MEEEEEESKLCVYLGCVCVGGGRQGSGKTPLEDQRHSQQHPDKIQRSARKRPEQSKKHKKLLKISPPCTVVS